jgi:hypothetical protein
MVVPISLSLEDTWQVNWVAETGVQGVPFQVTLFAGSLEVIVIVTDPFCGQDMVVLKSTGLDCKLKG